MTSGRHRQPDAPDHRRLRLGHQLGLQHPAVISSTGAVTRPGAGAEPAEVTLTATLTRGTGTSTKTFVATVLPDEGDQSKADAAAAALALVHPDDVRGHLTLPTTGRYASSVTWASSAPAIVAADGIVDRPAPGAGDASVTLTATVTVGSATATRAFPLTVRQAPAPAPYAGYAFSYFTGNSIAGEKIYFAASRGNNALRWDELNGGQPELESTYGEMGLRDPFLIRSPEGDRFFLIATDLSIGRNGDWDRSQRQGSRYLEVWESTDLKNWSEQRHVLVSPPTAGNTWAPEAYWDDDLAAVRRVLGVEALRRERPRPHRQHLQQDALCHDPRLRDLQRGQDLAGRRLLAHRLDGDQGGRQLLPLHQGRGRAAAPAAPTSSRRRTTA